jgi:hypothetical protein
MVNLDPEMEAEMITPEGGSAAPIKEVFADLEVHGRITVRYTFDPPIPAGTSVQLTGESDSAFMWHLIDYKEAL